MGCEKGFKRPYKKRAGSVDLRKRLRLVEQLLMRGITSGTICDMLTVQWQLTERQVRNYITRVESGWADEAAEQAPAERVAKRKQQFEGLLEVAMKMTPPDLRTAVLILDRLCKVDRVYADEVVRVAGTIDIVSRTTEEKKQELYKLMTKYADAIGKKTVPAIMAS